MKTFWNVWGGPFAIAVVTDRGLVGGLVGDGAWDWLAWIGPGLPSAALSWLGLRGRGASR